jgi:hypothetical protein
LLLLRRIIMAKKKRTTKKPSKRPAKKGKKRAPPKGALPKRAPVKRSSGNTSVDLLLKRFADERSSKESQLDVLRKKKQEIEDRVRKQREQLAKLEEQERKSLAELAQLDSRRDQEVSGLLAKLGVQLGGETRNVANFQSPANKANTQRESAQSDSAQRPAGNVKQNRDQAAQSPSGKRGNLN